VALLGFALGRIALVPEGRGRRAAATALVVCVIAVCIARLFIPGRYSQDGVTVLAGLVAFIIAGALPLPPSGAVRLLSPLTFGIYLVHPFVIALFVSGFGESGSLFRVFSVFAASAVMVYGMGRIPVLRRVV
jgi:peptidoglycan/LPS O-acetylase OafA/YrhL